jgi:ArsR family metal-binding transcriptional regulator
MKTIQISLSQMISEDANLSQEEKAILMGVSKYVVSIFQNDELAINIDVPENQRSESVKIHVSKIEEAIEKGKDLKWCFEQSECGVSA